MCRHRLHVAASVKKFLPPWTVLALRLPFFTSRLSYQRSHHTYSEAGCIGLFLNDTVSNLNTVLDTSQHDTSSHFLSTTSQTISTPRTFCLAVLDLLLLELENKILPHHSPATRNNLRFLPSVVLTVGPVWVMGYRRPADEDVRYYLAVRELYFPRSLVSSNAVDEVA